MKVMNLPWIGASLTTMTTSRSYELPSEEKPKCVLRFGFFSTSLSQKSWEKRGGSGGLVVFSLLSMGYLTTTLTTTRPPPQLPVEKPVCFLAKPNRSIVLTFLLPLLSLRSLPDFPEISQYS